MAAMLSWIAREYARFSAWMASQPDWVQGSIVGGVLVVLPACGAACWATIKWAFLRFRRWRAVRRETLAAKRLSFESFPSEPGEVDHGVNFTASMKEAETLLMSVVPTVNGIYNGLVSNKKLERLRKGERDYTEKKLEIIRTTASAMQDPVLSIEAAAKRLTELAQMFVAASRTVLLLPIRSDEDRAIFRNMQLSHLLSAASLSMKAEFMRQRSASLRRFDGKQQDLTRVIRRAVAALDLLAATSDGMADHCSIEMKESIDQKLSVRS